MFETKEVTSGAELKAEDEGRLQAVFSTFGVVDGDGDVVTKDAFTDGQRVPMVWSHDWTRPIGKGVVRVDAKRAIFDGQFFMDTTDGADAYRTVKAMQDLQEFSWGFRILDAEQEVRDGQPVRVITKAEVFEVSPVLVGANRETYVLSLKDAKRRLSRHQIDAVISVLQALRGEDADDDLDPPAADEQPPAPDAGKSAEPETLVDLAARLTTDVDAALATLHGLPEEDVFAAKDDLAALARRLQAAKAELDNALKRASLTGDLSPKELARRFATWEATHGLVATANGPFGRNG